MQWIGDIVSAVFKWFADALTWVGKLFVACFTALWDIARDVPAWIFDQVMSVAVSAVNSLDTSALSSAIGGGWGSIPSEIGNVLSLLGVGTAVSIIVAAIGIRLVLQLVPFTRLGS